MSLAQKYDLVPFEEYLGGERDVDVRSEYVDGQVYAMAGASEVHNTIAMAFAAAIENGLKDECRSWQSDMKVIGNNRGRYFAYYPDIMAACGDNAGDQYVRTNPVIIIEVLSPNTQRTDLTEKFANYTSISSLMEYAVVSQDVPLVRLFRRCTAWKMESHYADDTISLESVGLNIKVRDIYRRVKSEVGL